MVWHCTQHCLSEATAPRPAPGGTDLRRNTLPRPPCPAPCPAPADTLGNGLGRLTALRELTLERSAGAPSEEANLPDDIWQLQHLTKLELIRWARAGSLRG